MPASALVIWLSAGAPAAAAGAAVSTDHGCYRVGRQVLVSGSGFAPDRSFTVTIDGVDFGRSKTDSTGGFSSGLVPGGLAAGYVQQVDKLVASDGSSSAATRFTVTRATGARFLATRGNPHNLRAPLEVWGFALDGSRRRVYVHYVGPSGRARKTVPIGHTHGQCGYLRTASRRVFPFSPSVGRWTLQLDTARAYARHPGGPVARIRVRVH